MSPRIGALTASTVGGVLYSVFFVSTRRKMKFVIPRAPMLMTTPAMIWSTFQRIPSQARRSPTRPAASAAAMTPPRTANTMLPSGPRAILRALAVIAATHAPTRNLPSIAMLRMPLRSERMPANAPSEIGAASARVPASTPVRFAVCPASSAPRIAVIHSGMRIASERRHRNEAPR